MMRTNYKLKILPLLLLLTGCAANISFAQSNNDSIIFMDLAPLYITPLPDSQPDHPYLLFTKDELPAIRSRIKDPSIEPLWQKVLDDAINVYNNRLNIVDMVLPGCLAYQVTGDTLYARKPIQVIDTLIAHDHRWSVPDQTAPDLKYMNWTTSEKALAIAYVYDMLHDRLNEAKKDKYLNALKIKIFSYYTDAHAIHDTTKHKFYDAQKNFDWWTNAYHLWNSKINGSIGLAALATLWELPESPRVLKMARASLKYTHPEFNQDSLEDGGFDEGNMMLGKHLSYLTTFYQALNRVFDTDDGFFELPGIPESLRFYTEYIGPDEKFIPFAFNPHRRIIDPPSELHFLAEKYNYSYLHTFLDVFSHENLLRPFSVLWRPVINDTLYRGHLPKIKLYEDIHWGFLNDERFFIPFKGGDNASNHTQLDAGNIMLYLSETPLITSPGPGYDETRFQNCLLINNQGQLKGDPQQRILGKHSPLFSEVQNIQGKDDTEYAKIDITPCYEGLINYKRHLLLNNLGTFIVIDEVHPKDSSAVNIQWQTHYTFLKKNDGTYAVEGNRRGFNIHTTSTFNINAGISQHSYGQTLSLRSKHKAKHFILVTMFTPYAISSSDIDMRLEKDRLILDVQVRNKSERYIFTRTKTGLTFKKDI